MGTSLIRGVDPNGEVRTIAVTEDGEIRVTGISGGGSSGESSLGAEYTEGSTDAIITGKAILWEDDGNTLRTISKDTPLPVAIAGLLAALDDLKANILALSDRLPSSLVAGKLSVDGSDVVQPVEAESLPLPEGAARNATLIEVRDRIPATGTKSAAFSLPVVLSSDGPFSSNFGSPTEPPADSDTANSSFLRLFKRLLQTTTSLIGRLPSQQGRLAVIPRTVSKKFRDDFPGNSLDLSKWEVLQTGAGQTITVSNSELTIASGITANSETIIRSVDTYTIPFRVFANFRVNSRFNQEFYLEIIDSTGQHWAQWLLDGTSPAGLKTNAANSNNSIGATSFSTSADLRNTHQVFEIEASIDEINFYTRTSDTVTSRTQGTTRTRQIPDPNLEYQIRIRCKNISAPSATSSFIIDSIAVQDIEEVTAELIGGRGGGNANQAVPVQLTNTNQIAVAGGSAPVNVGDFARVNIETGTVLAANATFTASGRSTFHFTSNANTCRGWVLTDQPGTLFIDHSANNGGTWRQTHSWAVPISNPNAFLFDFKLHAGFFRVRYTNGPTAQSVMEIVTAQFLIGA